jgi:lysophospholipase L1-like esterase
VRGTIARAATVLLASGLLAATCSCSSAPQASTPSAQVDTWTAAPERLSASYQDRTIREIVHTTIGGDSLRLRLSNVFGSAPVRFDSVFVGVQSSGAGIVANSNQRVRFAESDAVTVVLGQETVSDPVTMTVHPGENLAVSVHVDGDTGTVTGHQRAQQQGWYAEGDATADTSGAPYAHQVAQWFWLDAVTVRPSYPAHTVVAVGDSITDGFRSTVDANRRWPNLLADRLGPTPRFGVSDEGIAGNQVTANGSGVSAQARLQRDVLDQPGAGTVIYLEGINDIGGHSVTSAAQLIKADSLIITRAHAAGLRILGGTLTPFEGFHTYSAATEAIRQAVNTWIRTSHAFDGVIDFDAALRDPSDQHRLRPADDSGDHLHPNDAGYQAMADAVPLQDLR